MTQSGKVMRRLACAVLTVCVYTPAQEFPPDYLVGRQHPRLLVPPARVRLLQRESQRETMRWVQFHTLVAGGAVMPEPGFALALYSLTSGNREAGRLAVDWALGPGKDLRQMALVFDWCHELLSPGERQRLAAKMRELLAATAGDASFEAARSRVMAAVALSGHSPGVEEAYIRPAVIEWWNRVVLEPLARGEVPTQPSDHYALVELLHVVRDNYNLDLRLTAPAYFTTLPAYHILAHYPAPFPAPENDYRIPLMAGHAQPDLRDAVRSRAAGLAMVAMDPNDEQIQFLQGWLIQDRFLLRSPFGAPYEFLWANPYQPGLNYHYLPNIFHDTETGRLIIRSDWEDSATWFFQSGGQLQMFTGGEVVNLRLEAMREPLILEGAAVVPERLTGRFELRTETPLRWYGIGLKPETRYEVEIDDEELREARTDRGGVLELSFTAGRRTVVRLREYRP